MTKKSIGEGGRKGRSNRTAVMESYRERELTYERTHRTALLKYSGRWIALEGEKVVASGTSVAQTIEDARSQGIESPYVFFVSADDAAGLGL